MLIDMYNSPEYIMEQVDGALLMPAPFFRSDALPTQDGKRIVVYRGSGARPRKTAEIAMEAGLSPLAHMEGGFGAWKAGQPYTDTDRIAAATKAMGPET